MRSPALQYLNHLGMLMTSDRRTKDALYYAEHRGEIRARKMRHVASGRCQNHPTTPRVSRTKCGVCLLQTRLSFLRRDGVPEVELQRAREAISLFDGCCQCCGGTQQGFGAGAGRDFALDHDHVTKRFRGIICAACNLTIGHAKESIERLLAIARYLS